MARPACKMLTHRAPTRVEAFRFAEVFRREGRLVNWRMTYEEHGQLWAIRCTVRPDKPEPEVESCQEGRDGRPSVYLNERAVLGQHDKLLARLKREFKEPRYDIQPGVEDDTRPAVIEAAKPRA
jgi:hypothetical protein